MRTRYRRRYPGETPEFVKLTGCGCCGIISDYTGYIVLKRCNDVNR